MRVDNQTSNPVEYEQTGGGTPDPKDEAALASQSGKLHANSETPSFTPVGTPPYAVKFTNEDRPTQQVNSCKFTDPDATVTLNDDWTVSVSSGCD
jgi:hypothetical protein